MSERAHTKGPWLIELDYFGDYTIHREHETLAIAAVVNGEIRRMGGQSDQHEANANLIAAAPDMFEALKRAREFIANGIELGFIRMPDAGTPDPAHDTLPAIEAALTKASPSPPSPQEPGCSGRER